MLKAEAIAATLRETRERRKTQVCRSYELKLDKSHVSGHTLSHLTTLFLEAKWFYNHILAQGEIFDADYKRKEVLVRSKNGSFETRKLECLSSQMRQEMIDRIKDSIRGLSILKKKGHRVGALKFKSRIKSIPLRQYGKTYSIIKDNRIRVQNIGQPLKVKGLEQIPKGAELTSATLEQRNGDYFVHITTFQRKVRKKFPLNALGIDFGIDKQLTLSNGLDIRESVVPTKRIRRIHRQLSRRKLHGRNWFKTKLRLSKEYERMGNQKRDIRNKLVGRLVSTYETICIQDDFVKGWQLVWGRRVQASAIGGIMSALKDRAHTLVEVPRFAATTQGCSRCGSSRKVDLEERVYQCNNCGLRIDRNFNSALNILNQGVPAERRELMPVDTKASVRMMGYFNGIPNVSASLVAETGSPRYSLVW